MGTARDMTFNSGDVIYTDAGTFVRCKFHGCTLIYSGGKHPTFEDCELIDVGWAFSDQALRTVQFLQTINASPGGQAFLAELFEPGKIIVD